MLTDVLDELAEDIMPDVFNEVGTELVEVVRFAQVATGYGGVANDIDTSPYPPIPCVLTYILLRADTVWALGEEYSHARITMPANYYDEIIEVFLTDKLKIQERPGANPERTFEIREINNVHGVYYDINVVLES